MIVSCHGRYTLLYVLLIVNLSFPRYLQKFTVHKYFFFHEYPLHCGMYRNYAGRPINFFPTTYATVSFSIEMYIVMIFSN